MRSSLFLETLKDYLTLDVLEFKYFCWVVYCFYVTKLVSREDGSELFSYVNCHLAAYGGSVLVPQLLGLRCILLEDPTPITIMSSCWLFANSCHTKRIWQHIENTTIASYLMAACFELFRLAVIIGWVRTSGRALNYSFLGTLICGTLGGSGGLFMPLSKGLSVLQSNLHWNIESAFTITFLFILNREYALLDEREFQAISVFALILARWFPKKRIALLKQVHSAIATILGIGKKQRPIFRQKMAKID